MIVPQPQLQHRRRFAIGTDVRDIEFEPGGNRAFLTENNPPSVLVLDTRVQPTPRPGQPLNQLSTSSTCARRRRT